MDKKSLSKLTYEVLEEIKGQIKKHKKSSVNIPIKGLLKVNGDFPTLHQNFMSQELLRSKGLIVASSTGAGKTLIGWLAYHDLDKKIKGRNARALVIGPNQAVDSAWTMEELGSYSQILKKREQSILRVHKVSDLEKSVNSDFVVINDDKLAITKDPIDNGYIQKLAALGKNYFDIIIFDEAHRGKNHAANRSKAEDELFTQINPESYRLVLTATPTWNGPNDIGMLLHYVDPQTIANPQMFDYTRDYDAASKVIGKYVYRLTRNELRKIIPIPELKTKVHEIELRAKARRDYIKEWEQGTNLKKGQDNKSFMKYLWRSREILAEEKIKYLEESKLVEKITKGNIDGRGRRQVVIFTQLKDKANGLTKRLEAMYEKRGFNVVRIDGSVPKGKRNGLAESFRSGEAEIAIVTSKTMGEGTPLNTHYKTNLPVSIVSLDEDFAPGARFQKEGRVVRPGQIGTVYYHELRGVDEKLSKEMKKSIHRLSKKHEINISDRIINHFPGTTLDQDASRISEFKQRINEEVLNGREIDEFQAIIASSNINALGSSLIQPLCVYYNLLSLIPTDTPSHLATLIASKWNGKGVKNLEDLTDKPLQKLYIDMYEANYDFTSSAHTARLLGKIITGLEEGVGKFSNIVDLGSGAAYVSRITKRQMTCIDIWKRMLDLGKEKTEELSIKNKSLKRNKYFQRRMQDTGLNDESMDLAISSYSLQYQSQGKDTKYGKENRELEDTIIETNRILQPKGYWLIALPRNLAKSSYDRFNKKLNHFGFNVADISGEYLVQEAFDMQGKKKVKKTPNKTRFKGVYVTVAQKFENSDSYLRDPNSITLYKPKGVGLLLGIKGTKSGRENTNTSIREICTGFYMRQGRRNVSVEEVVQKYARGL